MLPYLSWNEREITFGCLPSLPKGWHVMQLDSGHYMATNGDKESSITVNRFHARKWAFDLAAAPAAGKKEKTNGI